MMVYKNNFLRDLKVNDKVLYCTLGTKKIATITRLTDSTVWLDGFPQINRKNGNAKGDFGGTFSKPWIVSLN